MWPFSKRETKNNSLGVSMIGGVPNVRWSERTARTYSSEGYERCVIVSRCVQIVARSVASIPIRIEIGGVEQEKHPLLDLLAKPNPTMAQRVFVETVVAYHQITGCSYVEVLKAGSQPKELWPWMPFAMKVVAPDKGMMPLGFVYDDGVLAHKRTWEVDKLTSASDMLQLKTFNPADPFYGLSPIANAAYAADQHNEANAWNMRMLQNASVPSGALMSKGNLTSAQFSLFKDELESSYTGSKNARRPMVLSGDMSWIPMSLSPLEMDWLNGKNLSAREICAAFGVPTQVIPIQGDQTFANYEQARMALWQDTVIPLGLSIYDDMSRWFSLMYDEDLSIVMDLDQVPALEPARKEKWAAVSTATFLTTNEKREAVGYEPLEDTPMADRVLLPGTMQPMPTAAEQAEKDAMAAEIAGQGAPGAKPADGQHDPNASDKTKAPDQNLKEQVKRQLKAIGL